MKKARVHITIKPDVLDPAGVAVKNALHRLGDLNLAEVRIGKIVDIVFSEERDSADYLPAVAQAAKDILCNPVMEDFTIEVIE